MPTRIVCPLNVRFPDARDHRQRFGHRRPSASVGGDVGRDGGGGGGGGGEIRNVLIVDALEYDEFSCRGGSLRRLCSRRTLRVPWTPSLFVAVSNRITATTITTTGQRQNGASGSSSSSSSSSPLGSLRRDINFALAARKCGSVNATPRASVYGVVRSNDRLLWRVDKPMRLYEFTFDSYAGRRVAREALRGNSHRRSDDYALFAADDSVEIEVALATYARRPPSSIATTTTTITADDDDNDATRPRDVFIDLHEYFDMFSWCRFDEKQGQRLVKLSNSEIRANGLPENPFDALPVLSYDIETVARNENVVPRGVETDQRLASVAVSVHAPRANTERAVLAMAYVPLASDDAVAAVERRLRDRMRQVDGPCCQVMLFRQEEHLLYNAVETLRRNEPLVDLYELDDSRDAERLACVLLGYNCWDYDHRYLWSRLLFYGLYRDALRLMSTWREPRFCLAQISFDLMLYVKTRHGAQVGSIALRNVAKYFNQETRGEGIPLTERERRLKMEFDSVAIRRLYFDTTTTTTTTTTTAGISGGGDGAGARRSALGAIERFDERTALDDLNPSTGLNLLRVLLYNVQDCATVYHLSRSVNFYEMITRFCREFMVGPVDASRAGNSRLLPNAVTIHALRSRGVVLPRRWNRLSAFVVSKNYSVDDSGDFTSAFFTPREWYHCRDGSSGGCDGGSGGYSSGANSSVTTTNRRLGRGGGGGGRGGRTIADELELMRIDEDRVYIGGVNSAESGNYRYVCMCVCVCVCVYVGVKRS